MDHIAAAAGAIVSFRFDLVERRCCCTLRWRLAERIIIIIIIISESKLSVSQFQDTCRFNDNRECKHDVYSRRQATKMTSHFYSFVLIHKIN